MEDFGACVGEGCSGDVVEELVVDVADLVADGEEVQGGWRGKAEEDWRGGGRGGVRGGGGGGERGGGVGVEVPRERGLGGGGGAAEGRGGRWGVGERLSRDGDGGRHCRRSD